MHLLMIVLHAVVLLAQTADQGPGHESTAGGAFDLSHRPGPLQAVSGGGNRRQAEDRGGRLCCDEDHSNAGFHGTRG